LKSAGCKRPRRLDRKEPSSRRCSGEGRLDIVESVLVDCQAAKHSVLQPQPMVAAVGRSDRIRSRDVRPVNAPRPALPRSRLLLQLTLKCRACAAAAVPWRIDRIRGTRRAVRLTPSNARDLLLLRQLASDRPASPSKISLHADQSGRGS
jgi:hypothetical protein